MQKTTLHKKTVFLLFVFTLFFNSVNCQTFKEQFNDLVSKKDTVKQQQLLEKWENEGVSILLGKEKQSIINQTNSQEEIMELKTPQFEEAVKVGRTNQYDDFFK